MPGRSYAPPGTNPSGSKNALVIMIAVLLVLFLAGGGVYWWLSKDDPAGNAIPGQPVTQQNGSPAANAGGQNASGVPPRVRLRLICPGQQLICPNQD
jgi:flagellar basal body-associated protein FliL